MSRNALHLIAENKKNKAAFLSLCNCELNEIPKEVAELQWLQTIDLTNTMISNLAPLAELRGLQSINITNTAVHDLTPLSKLTNLRTLVIARTKISDLTPLDKLSELKAVNLEASLVTDLTPLAGLRKLKAIFASYSPIFNLVPLAGLLKLSQLSISHTKVSDLSPLSNLTELRVLKVSYTDVSDLAPLARARKLRIIKMMGSLVADLRPLLPLIEAGIPVLFRVNPKEGGGIHVKDCPLTNPPVEIASQGNPAILSFFQEKQFQGIDHLYEAKLLIVGEGGAGKTSLLRRLYQTNLPLPEENETTKGISIYRHEFKLQDQRYPEGRNFRLNVWDFGGQEIYHATHQFFLTKRSLYVLLDDTRKNHKTVHDEGFKYWLEAIDLLSGHSPVLIFQNEKDGRSKAIDLAGIKGKFDNVKERYHGNLEHSGSADILRDALEFYAKGLPHIGEELPAQWISIRTDIELQAQNKPTITQDEYFAIYKKYLPFDRNKALHLSRYLHDLGVFLHFQDDKLLTRTVILQNHWATEAVFKMLDDEIIKDNLGRFTVNDCERLWRNSEYSDMHPELLALMQKFELCYPLPNTQPDAWLAPQLLPPSKPTELSNWEQPGDLVLRFNYEFLPKGMISRLMVRQHRFVPRPDLGWVTGVLFERDGSQVLVEVSPKGGEIVLRSKGIDRKALLSVIAAELDALNDTFSGLREKVSKLVPCNCKKCCDRKEPEFFDQKRLFQRKKDDMLSVECPSSYENVDVLELLDGIRVNSLPSWAKNEDNLEANTRGSNVNSERVHEDNLEKLIELARNETVTKSFIEWIGEERAILAIVFTDIVGSTALGEKLGDEEMNKVRRAHFAKSRKLITQNKGHEIKNIGDSFMAVFMTVEKALDYALALQATPGDARLQIRAGIHVGPMQVEDGDVFGREATRAARVVAAIKDAEIWLSDEAKTHLDGLKAERHNCLKWIPHDDVPMKGFDGKFLLWSFS